MRSLAIVFAVFLSGSLLGCVDDVSDAGDLGDVGDPGKSDGDNAPTPDSPLPPSDPGCISPSGTGVSQKRGPGVCIPGTVNQLNAVPTR